MTGHSRASCDSKRIPAFSPADITPATSGFEAPGELSATSAIPFGHIPPTPKPTKNRSSSICSTVCTHAPSAAKIEYNRMLKPMARARPIRSPRLPSATPPTAAPSISAAVNRANQSPPDVAENAAPNRLLETDSAAIGIRPSSTPSNTNPSTDAANTAIRAPRVISIPASVY